MMAVYVLATRAISIFSDTLTNGNQIDKVMPKNHINEYIGHIDPAINYWWQKYQKAQLTWEEWNITVRITGG